MLDTTPNRRAKEGDTVELKPCPFCGQRKYVVMCRSGEPPYDYYVVCDASGQKDNPNRGCGGSAGAGESIDEARELWNRRANQ